MSTSSKSETVCERFSASDSDVTIRSSDSVLFKVHRQNLAICFEGFPEVDIETHNETVDLSETSATLELLFQFMYRQPQPDLDKMPFEALAALAEAAEKYRVYPAMQVCKTYMKSGIPEHPMVVFAYATRHGYLKMCDEAAPLTVGVSVEEALGVLGPATFISWVRYREHWIDVQRNSVHNSPPAALYAPPSCDHWHPFQVEIIKRLGVFSSDFPDIEDVFDRSTHTVSLCTFCCFRAEQWKDRMKALVTFVPKFSAPPKPQVKCID